MIPRRGWSPAGRVPVWDETGGPWLTVMRRAREMDKYQRSIRWMLAAKHIENVWRSTYNLSRRGIGDPEPFEFGSKMANHSLDCPRCQRPEAIQLWYIALKYTKTDDAVRAIREGRRRNG